MTSMRKQKKHDYKKTNTRATKHEKHKTHKHSRNKKQEQREEKGRATRGKNKTSSWHNTNPKMFQNRSPGVLKMTPRGPKVSLRGPKMEPLGVPGAPLGHPWGALGAPWGLPGSLRDKVPVFCQILDHLGVDFGAKMAPKSDKNRDRFSCRFLGAFL